MQGYRGGDEVRLLQKHLEDTPANFGVGPNRAKVALSILQQQVGERANRPVSIATQKPKSCVWEEITGVAILDDGMQVYAGLISYSVVLSTAVFCLSSLKLAHVACSAIVVTGIGFYSDVCTCSFH